MPATTTDIQAGTRRAKIVIWPDPADSTGVAQSAAIKARYPRARDGAVEPAEGMFDAEADAKTANGQRAGLFGIERRRFAIAVADIVWPDPAGAGIPVIALTDPEQGAAGLKTMSVRIEVDCGAEATDYEAFG
jgi:hypothetical protein